MNDGIVTVTAAVGAASGTAHHQRSRAAVSRARSLIRQRRAKLGGSKGRAASPSPASVFNAESAGSRPLTGREPALRTRGQSGLGNEVSRDLGGIVRGLPTRRRNSHRDAIPLVGTATVVRSSSRFQRDRSDPSERISRSHAKVHNPRPRSPHRKSLGGSERLRVRCDPDLDRPRSWSLELEASR